MRGNIGTPIIARVQLAREKHLVSLAVTKTSRTRLLVEDNFMGGRTRDRQ